MRQMFGWTRTGLMVAGLVALPLAAQMSGQSGAAGSGSNSPTMQDRTPASSYDMNRTSPVDRDRDGFNWGWLGLVGLAGLAGMRHRDNHRHDTVRNDGVKMRDDRV